jgi:xanthine dehydrogenase small subunit
MTEFILNNKLIKTSEPTGMSLLNFIREKARLKGTKSGCKEGDCGACTVMVGSPDSGRVKYQTVTSCLFPLGNAHGKHIVTIEGLNGDKLTSVQQSLFDNNATQCGFCTPGIVVSLSNYIINNDKLNFEAALNSVAGNICRCTGYKSIERAAKEIIENPESKNYKKNELPAFFKDIQKRLEDIPPAAESSESPIIAGGTDLLVQKPDEIEAVSPKLIAYKPALKGISIQNESVRIGASVTVSEFMHNKELRKYFPKIADQFKLISSEQIRNTATFAGNIVNASPIADLSIFLLALDAELIIQTGEGKERSVALKDFFKAYKKLDLHPGELILQIQFKAPKPTEKINFEKVSKRRYLDIASVNSCLRAEAKNGLIKTAALSAGGIGPIPFFARKTSEFLVGKKINETTIIAAARILNSEISPISDIRGSEKYKRLLLRQLFVAHFQILFPKEISLNQDFLRSLPTV